MYIVKKKQLGAGFGGERAKVMNWRVCMYISAEVREAERILAEHKLPNAVI
jgi:hypothetical protein